MHTESTILLIGAGRLARHLRHWNTLLHKPLPLVQWDRSQHTDTLSLHLKNCSQVWLAISDRALIEFYQNHLTDHKVVHFSGALSDPRLACAHPLMSFPQELLPDNVYPRIHFAISGAQTLNEVLPGFENTFSVLNAEEKSLYHALCVLAGNFPQLLWEQVSTGMHSLSLPPEALDLYIKQISENYLRLKKASLTGPLARKDHETMDNNIRALEKNKKLQHIYRTFREEFSK